MNKLLPTIFCVLFAFSTSSIAETLNLKCIYATMSDGTAIKNGGNFTLTFLVNTKTAKAYMIGNLGSVEVAFAVTSHGGMNFIESTQTGNTMVTAIDKKYYSVHSRHTMMDGELLPSQYYGKCK